MDLIEAFLSDDSSLCQVDVKVAITGNILWLVTGTLQGGVDVVYASPG